MNKLVTINGVKYKAIDTRVGIFDRVSCRECDVYKERPPQNMRQLPLCMEEEYEGINNACAKLTVKGIRRIYKKVE